MGEHEPAILIGETDREVFGLMSFMARSAGFTPVSVATVEELFRLAHSRPQAVIIGSGMMDNKGVMVSDSEIARRLKTNPDMSGIPIIHAPLSNGRDPGPNLYDYKLPVNFFVDEIDAVLKAIRGA